MKKIFQLCCYALLLFSISCKDEDGTELNYTNIDSLLADCNQLWSTAEEGDNLGEFVKGSKAIFESSIKETEYVRNNTDRQSALDNYCGRLETAKETFLSSKVSPACPLFDGTGYIDCGPASQFFAEKMTLEAWVYINEKTGGSIIGAEGSGDNGLFGLIVRVAEGVENAIDFTIVNGTWSSCLTPENSIEMKKWVHVAATFDSQTAKVYLNGVEAASMKIAPYIPEGNCKFIIGDLATWNGRFFRGKIYDVRVWHSIRTQQEIADNYRNILKGDEEGLVANWPLHVKSGNSIKDITGKYPATLINLTWSDLDNL